MQLEMGNIKVVKHRSVHKLMDLTAQVSLDACQNAFGRMLVAHVRFPLSRSACSRAVEVFWFLFGGGFFFPFFFSFPRSPILRKHGDFERDGCVRILTARACRQLLRDRNTCSSLGVVDKYKYIG